MQTSESVLNDPSLLLVFAYAPAGFGHLRVSDALYHGLPVGVVPVLLGAQDTTLIFIHRLMGIHPITRAITEWFERGKAEDIFTYWYRLFLRSKTKLLYQQMVTIIDERYLSPSTVVVVATHFGLAHQIAAIKKKLEEEKKVKLFLYVQVTDDSPHHIWYVDGADIIFVPSDKTKKELMRYGKGNVHFETVAYPLSPLLSQELTAGDSEKRSLQVEKESKQEINVAIPISGAAVGLRFFSILTNELYKLSHRFVFHIVSKNVSYTQSFLTKMSNYSFTRLIIAGKDRDVVDRYEELYGNEIISLEITKPSEQAFKALLDCTKRGASLLLFSQPVGRQEKDNLYFLERHNLIPSLDDEKILFSHAMENVHMLEKDKALLERASLWRGVNLPKDPRLASQFIWWCLQEGIFSAMMACRVIPRSDPHSHELNPNGVEVFWQKVAQAVEEKS